MNAQSQEKLRYFVVVGRIPGNDEDTSRSVQAKDSDDAIAQFKDLLWEGKDQEERDQMIEDDGSEAYVNIVLSSETEITIEYQIPS